MGKLGVFSYPEIPLDEAIGIIQAVATRMKGQVSRRGVAVALNQSEASGWLSHKLAALHDFGLVEGRGEGRLTALAQRLAFPTDDREMARAKGEAYRSVALFRLLEGRFQGEAPDQAALTVALEEITESPRHQVVKKVGLIRSHLSEAAALRRRPSTAEVAERLTQTLAKEGIAPAEGRLRAQPEAPRERPVPREPSTTFAAEAQPRSRDVGEPAKTPSPLEITVGEMRMVIPRSVSDETLDMAIGLMQSLKRR
ncbi:MAG: hypothetical protein EXR55_04295 [Dehalococcoidia bacterium]|nr:hypothetical protein [Dehalococcoidia bacterium]